MWISKKVLNKMLFEIDNLSERVSMQDQMLNALAQHQGLVIQANYNAPRFIVQKKGEANLGLCGTATLASSLPPSGRVLGKRS